MPVHKKEHSTPSPQVATIPSSSPGMPATEDFYQHLRREICQAAQSVIEAVLQEELAQFLAVGWGESSPDRKGYRNGFYRRDLATTAGRLEDLKVPREREGAFHTQAFERYSRYERATRKSFQLAVSAALPQ